MRPSRRSHIPNAADLRGKPEYDLPIGSKTGGQADTVWRTGPESNLSLKARNELIGRNLGSGSYAIPTVTLCGGDDGPDGADVRHARPERKRALNWDSGRSIMEILEEERRIIHRTGPANDNGCAGWGVMRDHSAGDLGGWLDGSDTSAPDHGPIGLRLVRSLDA